MIVRARKEPPVTSFAQEAVPDAADLGRVNARTAVGAATNRVGGVATTGRLSTVARHRLETERDLGAGVVEVTQVFDVEAIAAGRVIDAGALEVGRHEIGRRGRLLVHPLDAFD